MPPLLQRWGRHRRHDLQVSLVPASVVRAQSQSATGIVAAVVLTTGAGCNCSSPEGTVAASKSSNLIMAPDR